MNKLKFVLLVATLALALALTLSCSNDDGDGGNGSLSGNPQYERMKEELKYYDPDDVYEPQKCQNGIVEYKCEVDGKEVWYNPLTHGCIYDQSCVNSPDGEHCETTYYGLGTIEICGNELYLSIQTTRRCQNGVLQRKCGDVWYNRETHYCDWDYDSETEIEVGTVRARAKCGSKYYIPDEEYTRCQNGVIQDRCGYDENSIWYNYETEYCSYNWDDVTYTSTYTIKPRERCGSVYLDGDYERCNNGVVEERCGSSNDENSTWYNYIKQTCDWHTGTVKGKLKCGS